MYEYLNQPVNLAYKPLLISKLRYNQGSVYGDL